MNPLVYFRNRKPSVVAGIVLDKLFNRRIKHFDSISFLFKNKKGIEIGGPSRFFTDSGFLPIYSIAEKVDGCNFSNQTTWEGEITAGETYCYHPGKKGFQFICEGADVEIIPKGEYDFVLSCNNLEHIANPLKAVDNWLKLLKNEGAIVLVLPRKESNFDHKRSITPFDHLLEDYKNNTKEDDLTHLNEILNFHDLSLDPPAGNIEQFRQRSMVNYSNRCLHHHVYDLALLEEICNYFGLAIVSKTSLTTDHIIVAKKGV